MIVCPRCSKENQDHYKFCLGCGAELPREAVQPKNFTAPTPPSGVPAVKPPRAPSSVGVPQVAAPAVPSFGGAPALSPGASSARNPAVGAAQPPPAPSAEVIKCAKCGAQVPANFKFCGTCGHPVPASRVSPGGMPMDTMQGAQTRQTTGTPRGTLTIIRPDGTQGAAFPLADSTVVGRETSPEFAGDAFLSPRHASFSFRKDALLVRDENTVNGVYIRLEKDVPTEIQEGSIFRIGQEVIAFEKLPAPQVGAGDVQVQGSPNPGYVGRICLVIGREQTGNCFCVGPDGLHIGRERGDALFPDDGYVSGLHCRLHYEGGRIFLTDLGSSNGTFLRIHGEISVKTGSLLLMGQHLFQVQYQ